MMSENAKADIPLLHKVTIVSIMVLLVLASVMALRLALADIYGYQAKRTILRWENQTAVTEHNYNQALHWIEKARALDADNPKLMEYQGRILGRSKYVESLSIEDIIHNDELTADLYRQVLLDRPMWPYAWVALANIKAQLYQFDEEFSLALARTIETGPWESLVQWQLVIIGFSYWHNLNQAEQDLIQQTFDRAMLGHRYRKALTDLAKTFEQLAPYCERTQNAGDLDDYLKRVCKPYLQP